MNCAYLASPYISWRPVSKLIKSIWISWNFQSFCRVSRLPVVSLRNNYIIQGSPPLTYLAWDQVYRITFSVSLWHFTIVILWSMSNHNTVNLQNRSVKNIIIGMRVATCMRGLSLIDQYTSPLPAISITLKSTLEIFNHPEKMCSFMTGACMLGALNFQNRFVFTFQSNLSIFLLLIPPPSPPRVVDPRKVSEQSTFSISLLLLRLCMAVL